MGECGDRVRRRKFGLAGMAMRKGCVEAGGCRGASFVAASRPDRSDPVRPLNELTSPSRHG